MPTMNGETLHERYQREAEVEERIAARINDQEKGESCGSSLIDFKFIEYNPRRALRGKEAARVAVIDDGEEHWLWMSEKDLRLNIKKFGNHPELLKARLAYHEGGVA